MRILKDQWCLSLCALLAVGPVLVNAQSITYDFTGVVVNESNNYGTLVTNGETVTGTYTLDFDNANSNSNSAPPNIGLGELNYGSISTTSNWAVGEQSGSAVGVTQAAPFVFSSSAVVGTGSYIYSSAAPGPYYSFSNVVGQASPTSDYGAGEYQYAIDGSPTSGSTFSVEAIQNSNAATYTADGLPVILAPGTTNPGLAYQGQFAGSINGAYGIVYYDITSLTPVPEPSVAWLILFGLGGLGSFARKRSAQAVTPELSKSRGTLRSEFQRRWSTEASRWSPQSSASLKDCC